MKPRSLSKYLLKKLDYRFSFWDWKEQPDFADIQKHIVDGFIYFQLPDNGSDMFCLVMTKEKISEEAALIVYECSMREMARG